MGNKKKIMTLCLVYQHPRILLGMKKRGFGVGRWNGFGGKVEEGETIEESARRETREEAGIELLDMEKVGIFDFSFRDDPKILAVHLFKTNKYSGQPQETEEIRPQWFDISALPFDHMWSDDRYWMPFFLAGKKFRARFRFDRPSDETYASKILEHEIVEVENL